MPQTHALGVDVGGTGIKAALVDLTTGVDRNKLQIFGKTPDKKTLSRHDGVEEFPSITTISESPLTASSGRMSPLSSGGRAERDLDSEKPGSRPPYATAPGPA